jgi:regulatory protein
VTVEPATIEVDEKKITRAKNCAYRYLTIRPRSRHEVEQKLRDREFPPAIVASVLSHLEQLGYLNDEEFARQWATSRVRMRGFGRRRIEQELRNKGVSPSIIKATIAALLEEAPEVEVARKEAEKKLRTLSRFEREVRRRRIAGHLERKGFPMDVIIPIVRTIK